MAFLKRNIPEISIGVIVVLLGSIMAVGWARIDKVEDRLLEVEKKSPLTEYQITILTTKIDEQTAAMEKRFDEQMAALDKKIAELDTRLSGMIKDLQQDIKDLLRSSRSRARPSSGSPPRPELF